MAFMKVHFRHTKNEVAADDKMGQPWYTHFKLVLFKRKFLIEDQMQIKCFRFLTKKTIKEKFVIYSCKIYNNVRLRNIQMVIVSSRFILYNLSLSVLLYIL